MAGPAAGGGGDCAGRPKNAAIDDKLCSLDVSCLIRREKEDGAGYIFGPTDAIEWNHRLEATRAAAASGGTAVRPRIGVSITPGTTALTLIPRGESPPTSERHIARTPTLLAA